MSLEWGPGKDDPDLLRVPGYAPEAVPGPRIEGLTGDWSDALAQGEREAAARAAAAEPARHRHARGHVFLGAVARGIGTALLAAAAVLAAAGTAVRGMGMRHLP